MIRNKIKKELLVFLIIGALINLLSIVVFYIMAEFAGVNRYISIYSIFIFASILSYFVNAKFTFNVRETSLVSLTKFFVVNLSALGIQTLVMFYGSNFDISETIVYTFGIVISTAVNFVLLKLFVFGSK